MADAGADSDSCGNSEPLFQIKGRVFRPDFDPDVEWYNAAYITVSGGAQSVFGFLQADGSFVVNGLPSGSYVVDVTNVRYRYESLRVDISSRGRVRARRLNHLQPSEVSALPYPLKLRPDGRVQYFVAREHWRITDILFSPMILMMVLPVFLIVLLPKLMSDPETKKEMEQLSLPRYDGPDLSEFMTSLLGGNRKPAQKQAKKKN